MNNLFMYKDINVFKKLNKGFKLLRRVICPTTIDKNIHMWHNIDGDRTLRLNYDMLDEKSIVLDIGGYKGDWASSIFSKYCCTIHVFEPVSYFAEFL